MRCEGKEHVEGSIHSLLLLTLQFCVNFVFVDRMMKVHSYPDNVHEHPAQWRPLTDILTDTLR